MCAWTLEISRGQGHRDTYAAGTVVPVDPEIARAAFARVPVVLGREVHAALWAAAQRRAVGISLDTAYAEALGDLLAAVREAHSHDIDPSFVVVDVAAIIPTEPVIWAVADLVRPQRDDPTLSVVLSLVTPAGF